MRLRDATGQAHRQIDQSAVMARLLQDDVDRDGVLRALQGLYGPQRALEEALSGAGAEMLEGWTLLPRAPAIRADWLALSAQLNPSAAHTWTERTQRTATSLQGPRSRSEAVGMLYVLEGSLLGATVIARHLERKLPEFALTSFAAAPPQRWASFWRWVATDAVDEAVAKKAALAAFEVFADSLLQGNAAGGTFSD